MQIPVDSRRTTSYLEAEKTLVLNLTISTYSSNSMCCRCTVLLFITVFLLPFFFSFLYVYLSPSFMLCHSLSLVRLSVCFRFLCFLPFLLPCRKFKLSPSFSLLFPSPLCPSPSLLPYLDNFIHPEII
jgi:hypothetical protein